MNKHFQDFVLNTTGATAITSQQVIQTLWSGYGEVVRVELAGFDLKSAVLKYIVFPSEAVRKRGQTPLLQDVWNSCANIHVGICVIVKLFLGSAQI